MARTTGKRAVKANNQTTTATSGASTASPVTTSSISSSSIPHPFEPLKPSLRAFTSTLPTDHVYAIHIDRTPIALKRRVFMVPVLLNFVLAALLAVRVYFAAPQYLELIITTFGYETSWSVQPRSMDVGDIMGTISSRTLLLMLDYFLFALLGRWPWEFVMGDRRYGRSTGALDWRRTLGFQVVEIVVRKGRKWDTALTNLEKDNKEKEEQRIRQGKPGRSWAKEEELTVQMKLEAALRKSSTDKTGYLLLDKEWDLDFRAMIDAHRLVERGKLKMADLDHVALVNVSGQWGMWYPQGNNDGDGENNANGIVIAKDQRGKEDKKVQTFREALVEMGCEAVFYRWIEMVQYETSQPGGGGGFSESKKKEAVSELKKMIRERGKNEEDLWQKIGGFEGVPGLEEQDREVG